MISQSRLTAEVMITQVVIPGDERMLMEPFGEAYEIYRVTTARLIASL
jgi:protein-S-isoprenylcysteine O-methyltransferase Ste14